MFRMWVVSSGGNFGSGSNKDWIGHKPAVNFYSKVGNMIKPKQFAVGLDIGYSNVKIACGYTEQYEPATSLCPAYATSEEETDLDLAKKSPNELKVYPNQKEWRVFTNRIGHRELHDKYHTSDMYMALFYGALIKATEGRTNVIDMLVTGLPVKLANSDTERELLAKRLTGQFEVYPGRTIVVKQVEVISQGVGTMNDVLNTADLLSDDDIENSNILVVDPGFYSLDYIVFVRGERKAAFSGSSLIATSVIIDSIVSKLEADFPDEGSVDPERIETALRNKESAFHNGFRNIELKPLLTEILPRITDSVVSELQMRTRSVTLHITITAGGGAIFYEDAIEHAFPKARKIVSRNPVASNSVGYWHFAVDELQSES